MFEWNSSWILMIVFFLIIFIFYKKRKYNVPPGPTGLPFIGYYPFINNKQPYKQLKSLAEKFGDVFSFTICGKLVVVCGTWKAVKDAYGQRAISNRPHGFFGAMRYGLGLASENGSVWSQQRQFSVRAMKDLGLGTSKWENFLQEEVKDTVECLKKYAPKAIDVTPFLSNTFTSNLLTLLFGYRLLPGDEKISYISKSLDIIMQNFAVIRLDIFLPKLCGFLTKIGLYGSKNSMELLKEFDNFTVNWVQQRLIDHESDGEDSFIYKYFKEVQNSKPKGAFTEDSLYGNTQAFLLGGSETTRTSLIWLLLTMANNQATQAEVHRELDAAVGKDNVVYWSDRSKIPFTYACIMESLRLNVTVPINPMRKTEEDIKIFGYDVPKGSIIIANNWAIHNDPNYWEKPEQFDPHRFLFDNGTKINFKPDSYMPFSYGKRNCPGEQVALMEMFCYFTNVMQKFTVLPESGNVVKFRQVLGLTSQASDVKLRFVPRE